MHCIAIFQFSLIYNFISLTLVAENAYKHDYDWIMPYYVVSYSCTRTLKKYLISPLLTGSSLYIHFFYLMHRWISSFRMSLFKLCSISQFFFHFLSLLLLFFVKWMTSVVCGCQWPKIKCMLLNMIRAYRKDSM
mgnify:CR=1 FL=1